jgi:putative membrane protein
MTYLDIQFLLIPVLFAATLHVSRRRDFNVRHWWLGLAVLSVIASVWTTPWDNWMVATGVWGYPPHAVLGTIGYIPAEEQAFFVVQTLLTGGFLGLLIDPRAVEVPARPAARLIGAAAVGTIIVGGAALYVNGFSYMGSMCFWFGMPLALQLAWGADQLLRHLPAMVPAVLLPTAVLCHIDALAVREGTWFFDESALTGIMVGALPLEEVVFFAFTNVLIVVGMTLWHELPRRSGLSSACCTSALHEQSAP